MDEEALIDRTLYHLSACIAADEARVEQGVDAVDGPGDSSWAELLAAIMEGFERGWVDEAQLYREDGETRLTWRETDSGERAMRAFRRRRRTPPADG